MTEPAERPVMELPIVHVLGARPNFVKAAPVIAALRSTGLEQYVVHTGQHYDDKMSDIFFTELDLPSPDVNLGVGSGTHAQQTAEIMVGLEREFTTRSPGLVMVYGDVNSTVAAALVAAKLRLPVAHVEAGLRSFDASMPEEINRRITDQLSDLLFATSPEAIGNLAAEGVPVDRVHLVGNPMIDTLLGHLDRLDPEPVRARHGLPDRYVVATLHRPANVDSPAAAARLVRTLKEIATHVDVVMPVHPRGRAVLTAAGLRDGGRIHLREPLGYLEFVALVRGAAAVVTDSGGVLSHSAICAREYAIPCVVATQVATRMIEDGSMITVDGTKGTVLLQS